MIRPPGNDPLWLLVFDGGHALVFGLVALAGLVFFSPLPRNCAYAAAFFLAAFLGGLLELIQIPIDRNASWMDWGRDLLGIIAFLAAAAAVDLRRRQAAMVRVPLLLIALATMLWVIAPVARWAQAQQKRAGAFPVLMSFAHPWERSLAVTYHGARLNYAPLEPGGPAGVHVEFPAGRGWPQMVVWVEPDWTGYRELVVDVHSPSRTPQNLVLILWDRVRSDNPSDRHHARRALTPGHNTLRLSLDDLTAGGPGARLDLSRMKAVALVAGQPDSTFFIWVDNLRLE